MNEEEKKVVEDYKRFNDIHDIGEYSFFGVEDFLLSCSYNEIVWVYIPENWMAMSKSIASSLSSSYFFSSLFLVILFHLSFF